MRPPSARRRTLLQLWSGATCLGSLHAGARPPYPASPAPTRSHARSLAAGCLSRVSKAWPVLVAAASVCQLGPYLLDRAHPKACSEALIGASARTCSGLRDCQRGHCPFPGPSVCWQPRWIPPLRPRYSLPAAPSSLSDRCLACNGSPDRSSLAYRTAAARYHSAAQPASARIRCCASWQRSTGSSAPTTRRGRARSPRCRRPLAAAPSPSSRRRAPVWSSSAWRDRVARRRRP